MNPAQLQRALQVAVRAARAAGAVMRRNLHLEKRIHAASQHDIKLELDVRCQKLIERTLRGWNRDAAVLGEEGVSGKADAACRWVVDPIDGTVNFTYGLPHAAVSIALQERVPSPDAQAVAENPDARYQTVVGVVYDPFCDDLWTAIRGGPARLNDRIIHASDRTAMREAIVAMGFAKSRASLGRMLPTFGRLVHRVRKIRIMGSAALSGTYVATGCMDAYVEYGLRLWDIAAAALILECAGGDAWCRAVDKDHTYEIAFSNGKLRKALMRIR